MKLQALMAGLVLIASLPLGASVSMSNVTFNTSGGVTYWTGSLSNVGTTAFTSWGSSGIHTIPSLGIGVGLEVYMTIGGTTPGTNYPVREVTGTVTLQGVLNINGYSPALGESISPIKYGNRVGMLRKIITPALPAGLAWEVRYLPHEFRLTVVSATNAPQLVVRPGSLPNLFEFEVQGIIGKTIVAAYSTNSVDWVPFYTNALPGGAQMFAVQMTNLPNATFKAYQLP